MAQTTAWASANCCCAASFAPGWGWAFQVMPPGQECSTITPWKAASFHAPLFSHYLHVGLALGCSDAISQREALRPQQETALPYSNVQGKAWTRSQMLLPSYLPEAEELNWCQCKD